MIGATNEQTIPLTKYFSIINMAYPENAHDGTEGMQEV